MWVGANLEGSAPGDPTMLPALGVLLVSDWQLQSRGTRDVEQQRGPQRYRTPTRIGPRRQYQ